MSLDILLNVGSLVTDPQRTAHVDIGEVVIRHTLVQTIPATDKSSIEQP